MLWIVGSHLLEVLGLYQFAKWVWKASTAFHRAFKKDERR